MTQNEPKTDRNQEIADKYSKGATTKELSDEYGISRARVHQIAKTFGAVHGGRRTIGDNNKIRIMRFIESYIRDNGYAPSLKEISIGVGFSPWSGANIGIVLDELQSEGALVRRKSTARAMRLLISAQEYEGRLEARRREHMGENK